VVPVAVVRSPYKTRERHGRGPLRGPPLRDVSTVMLRCRPNHFAPPLRTVVLVGRDRLPPHPLGLLLQRNPKGVSLPMVFTVSTMGNLFEPKADCPAGRAEPFGDTSPVAG